MTISSNHKSHHCPLQQTKPTLKTHPTQNQPTLPNPHQPSLSPIYPTEEAPERETRLPENPSAAGCFPAAAQSWWEQLVSQPWQEQRAFDRFCSCQGCHSRSKRDPNEKVRKLNHHRPFSQLGCWCCTNQNPPSSPP